MKLLTVPFDYKFTPWDLDDLTTAAYYGGKTRAFLLDAELELETSAMFACNVDIAVSNARDSWRWAERFLSRAAGPKTEEEAK